MLLLIGSEAARLNRVDLGRYRRLDVDFIATKETIGEHLKAICPTKVAPDAEAKHVYATAPDIFVLGGNLVYEYEIAWDETTSKELLDQIKLTGKYAHEHRTDARVSDPAAGMHVASIDLLLALKLSHRYKKNSVHFLKTMRDIQTLRRAGAKLDKWLTKWVKRREKETYNYKHPKLMGVKKGEFFSDDGINYVYDHDSIHAAVKHLEAPAYSRFQPSEEEIGTSKHLFFACPLSIQLLAVLEESYVLSLERAIIPFNLRGDTEKCRNAFTMALDKVCTSITSGWFREFAWENYDKVQGLYDAEYIERFYAAVDAGEVKLHEK